jgi:hypothetical protein
MYTVWFDSAIGASTVHGPKPWDDTCMVELVSTFRDSVQLVAWYPFEAYRTILFVVIGFPCYWSSLLVVPVHLISNLDFLSTNTYLFYRDS